ncbi:hypothetical protein B0O99DRAFT_656870 [Bisporella sp. PMI_857]|nr:hypothetical protein B0O99DRAFT_656870 [Bisporella sp. PMI_857]
MPHLTDKCISIAVYEMLHNLLKFLVEAPKDPICRATVVQEISNVSHGSSTLVVYTVFKRHVQTGSSSKHFRRVYGVYDNGVARVAMKGKLELLTRDNPQLHSCFSVVWIQKLDDLHHLHPSEREDMQEREFESFCDIAVIAGFVQSLSAKLHLPSINAKKGQMYVSKSKELAAELDALKADVDPSDFTIPIDNLLEPGMTTGALERTRKDLIEMCVSNIREFFLRQRTRAEFIPLTTIVESSTPEVRVRQRRQKDKTRPTCSSSYDIALPPPSTQSETQTPPPVFKVKAKTIEVFSTLFSKSAARGSITWLSFEAAMAGLKFSVIPKFGSVFRFCPAQGMGVQKSLTLHRPHKAKIEGHLLLIFTSRLRSVYGWDEESFEAAEGK